MKQRTADADADVIGRRLKHNKVSRERPVTPVRLKPVTAKNRRAILGPTMNRSLTTFLVWLLMAILPLHAIAASVGMSCAPDKRQASQNIALAAPTHHDAGADMHAHHGAHASDTNEAAPDTHDSHGKADGQAHSSCSACSALCIGAVAPPPPFLAVPAFDGTDVLLISSSTPVPGFIPDGLQRPPRRHSA